MKKRVKQYSDEVKKQAVRAVLRSLNPLSVAAAAKLHKVGRSTLNKWVATEVRARLQKGIINVKPKRLLPTLPEKQTWQHPNGDTFVHQWKAESGSIVPELESSMMREDKTVGLRQGRDLPTHINESKNFNPISKPYVHTSNKIETLDFIADKELDYILGRAVSLIIQSSFIGFELKVRKEHLQKAAFLISRKIDIIDNKIKGE